MITQLPQGIIRFHLQMQIDIDLDYYKKLIEDSEPSSKTLYSLGEAYLHGNVFMNINIPKAIKYFTMASNKEHSDAMIRLGEIYENGIGVEQDLSIAMHWYTQADKKGNEIASSKLVLACLSLMDNDDKPK